MDPITQFGLGAVVAQSLSRRQEGRSAAIAGALAGIAADADTFIRSSEDPLLVLEYHRQFTHSLLFAPAGALIVAGALWPFLRGRVSFGRLLLFTLSGYLSGILIDACTSYGTHLLWPLNEVRYAWDLIAVVDPFFTLPILVLAILAFARRRAPLARLGLAFSLAYLALGAVQHERAEALILERAAERGHAPERLRVMPTIGNLLLWRTVYLSGGAFHVDAVRPGLSGSAELHSGGSVERFDLAKDLDGVDPGTVLHEDVLRFARFTDGYLALDPGDPAWLMDLRYALLPDRIRSIWGLSLSGPPEEHADFRREVEVRVAQWRRFMAMLMGRDPGEDGP